VKNSRIYFYFYETKGRGAKGYSRPSTLKSRGAKIRLAPVESAPKCATFLNYAINVVKIELYFCTEIFVVKLNVRTIFSNATKDNAFYVIYYHI
jgi:hypothetical protein